ncbi:MAG TPA: DUF3300 domain-containing protein [Rubrivivax sp.]|nr:DUF3300 domain-containing protein [Rubrivivax sp.]
MSRLITKLLVILLSLAVALPGWTQSEAPTYSKEQLDQLLAPIALYPDSLLTQVLMAATYPVQVSEAVSWSASHPNDKGDAAVTKAEGQGWEPAVTSLVAFPQVLATMGQKPEWVQDLGDAFLAQPNDTMDAVQRLRRAAQSAGQLKSNEQQKVVIENPTPQQSVIVIQPAQPQVVYVPMYNPTVVYGAWPYPSYPPYYIPPPPGYYVGNALLTGMAFGAGLAITNSLWGGYNWGRNDVDININRYNNVNVNRRITNNQNNFTHNSAGRKGVPYRDAKVDQKYGKNVSGKDARNDYRGRDANDAKRDAARETMAQRTNDPKTREKLQQQGADRAGGDGARERAAAAAGKDRPGSGATPDRAAAAKDRAPGAGAGDRSFGAGDRNVGAGAGDRGAGGGDRGGDRAAAAQRPAPASRDNALKHAGNGNAERASMERGQASRQAAAKPAARPQPSAAAARPAPRPQAPAARPAAPKPKAGGGGGGAARGGARGR